MAISLPLLQSNAQAAEAQPFQLAPLFSDGAVLQQGKPVPVWGLASPGEEVTVEFSGQSKTTQADSDGRWMLRLDPLAETSQPQILRVRHGKAEALEVKDVLVGDVWLCSGQSNMARALKDAPDAANFPLIRGWVSPRSPSAKQEFSNGGSWSSNPFSTSATVDGWSAVAYYFAREVQRETGTPIGLIMTAYGGTEIEAWVKAEAIKESGANKSVQARWENRLAQLPVAMKEWEGEVAAWEQAGQRGEPRKATPPRAPEGVGSRKQPGALYNGMVAPFIPYALRGMLWYQGESNVGRHDDYRKLFLSLIQSWRKDFGQGDLPFYFVQLPRHEPKAGSNLRKWAYLREAQTGALELPKTGMAVTIDVGDPHDLHPDNKLDVGRRLARLALKNDYGKTLVAAGPEYVSATREGALMRVKFRPDPKLDLRAAEGPAFEVAGADGHFVPATARIDGSDLLVSCPEVNEPVAVRYAWWDNPAVVLFGNDGLPAAPFRSDDAPLPEEERANPAAQP